MRIKDFSFAKLLGIIISFPKTIYFNFRTLPFSQAIKLPIFIWYNVRILDAKRGVIKFPNGLRPFMIGVGKGGTKEVIAHSYGQISIGGGTLCFLGSAGFASGVSLDCTGDLTFGASFSTNKNAFISCSKKITFGDRVMLGDNCIIRDSDGHTVTLNGLAKTSQRPIYIGDHVWIASHAHILKGSSIPHNCIVAYRSLVTRQFDQEGALIAGSPAKVVQTGIDWGVYDAKKEARDNCN